MTDSIDSFFAEWSAAERTGDTAKLDHLLAGDFAGIGPLGFSLPKPAWLARHGQGLRYDAFAVQDLQVRTYGEVAVVTGRHLQHGTFAGNPIPEAVRATHVLVRDAGRWRLAAMHMSFVAGTPGAPPIPGGGNRPGGRSATATGGRNGNGGMMSPSFPRSTRWSRGWNQAWPCSRSSRIRAASFPRPTCGPPARWAPSSSAADSATPAGWNAGT